MVERKEMSFINAEEVAEATREITAHLIETTGFADFELPHATGYHMWVKLYTRPEDIVQLKDDAGNALLDEFGKPRALILPKSVTTNDKWSSCVALVVQQGPDCYTGKRFEHSGPWCRVGDWIVIPRNEGIQVSYRGIPMQLIPDDRAMSIIKDPTHVVRD